MSRAERSAEATALREQGHRYRDIAERMRISISYAQALVKDPEGVGERLRKKRYERPCEGCGKPINPNGLVCKTGLCAACLNEQQSDESKAHIIREFHRFVEEFGRVPTATDWNAALARNVGMPVTPGHWPAATSVQYQFGSWSNGLRAAGLEARKPYGPPPGSLTDEERQRTLDLYQRLGVTRAAQELGISVSGVYMRLRPLLNGGTMSAPIRPLTAIEREIDRNKARQESLREQFAQAEQDGRALEQARALLAQSENGKAA